MQASDSERLAGRYRRFRAWVQGGADYSGADAWSLGMSVF